MILFLGMAAMAVDLGFAVNERRQDQSAADSGVMAGALDAINAPQAMVTETIAYVRANLDTTFSNADWQTAWDGCVDPAAERNAGGFDFVALDPPPGWTVSDPANWCISIDAAESLYRVRIPVQITNTTFGKVLGVDEFRTRAAAVARLGVGGGGTLPLGFPQGAGPGLSCLSGAPLGLMDDPCDGTSPGTLGAIELRKFGRSGLTNPNCLATNPSDLLAQNLAHGADHIVFRDLDGAAANEQRDICFEPDVDTLLVDPSYPGIGLEEGLVGPVPMDGGFSYVPRLAQSGPLVTKFGFSINDEPLWDHLDPSATYGGDPLLHDAPSVCDPVTFDGLTNQDWDFPGDGVDDPNSSWKHMDRCLNLYGALNYTGVMFQETIDTNTARFVYLPQFWGSLGPGSSWENIRWFRAVYIQNTMWQRGVDYYVEGPGEPNCWDAANGGTAPCNPSGSWAMVQVSVFGIPDASLPEPLRGSSLAGAVGVNPYEPSLYR